MDVISQELQLAQLDLQKLKSLETLLIAGADDPRQLIITGNDVLKSQPSLQRLKDGLIDAQIAASKLASIYTVNHPRRRAAITTQREIIEKMVAESKSAVLSMRPQVTLAENKVQRLLEKQDSLTGKLNRLAEVRTEYSRIDAEVKAFTQQLAKAEAALSEAEASRAAALSTNLLTEMGPPEVGEKPEGLSGPVALVGSTFAGLVFGLGAVFLIAPGPTGPTYGRRISDYISGRRASDPGNYPPDKNHQGPFRLVAKNEDGARPFRKNTLA